MRVTLSLIKADVGSVGGLLERFAVRDGHDSESRLEVAEAVDPE